MKFVRLAPFGARTFILNLIKCAFAAEVDLSNLFKLLMHSALTINFGICGKDWLPVK